MDSDTKCTGSDSGSLLEGASKAELLQLFSEAFALESATAHALEQACARQLCDAEVAKLRELLKHRVQRTNAVNAALARIGQK